MKIVINNLYITLKEVILSELQTIKKNNEKI